jgi:hypothetical protein
MAGMRALPSFGFWEVKIGWKPEHDGFSWSEGGQHVSLEVAKTPLEALRLAANYLGADVNLVRQIEVKFVEQRKNPDGTWETIW